MSETNPVTAVTDEKIRELLAEYEHPDDGDMVMSAVCSLALGDYEQCSQLLSMGDTYGRITCTALKGHDGACSPHVRNAARIRVVAAINARAKGGR